jgi:hypothetical protein
VNSLALIVFKLFVVLLLTAVCFTPSILYAALWHLASPEGFWQKIFLVGLGVWFLAAIQFVLAIVWIAGTIAVVLWDGR